MTNAEELCFRDKHVNLIRNFACLKEVGKKLLEQQIPLSRKLIESSLFTVKLLQFQLPEVEFWTVRLKLLSISIFEQLQPRKYVMSQQLCFQDKRFQVVEYFSVQKKKKKDRVPQKAIYLVKPRDWKKPFFCLLLETIQCSPSGVQMVPSC